MDLDSFLTPLEPRLLLEAATPAKEPHKVGAQILRVAKLKLGAVQEGRLKLFLELGFVRDCGRSTQLFLILRVEALVECIFEGEFLVIANNHSDEGVDKSCHSADQGEGLIESVDLVLSLIDGLALLDGGNVIAILPVICCVVVEDEVFLLWVVHGCVGLFQVANKGQSGQVNELVTVHCHIFLSY